MFQQSRRSSASSSEEAIAGEKDEAAPRRGRGGRPPRTALMQGIAMLSRREYSRHELSNKLRQSKEGYGAEEIETALDRLTDEKWQSDLRFAQALVRMRGNSGYGPLRIRNELQTHRIPSDEAADAMSQFDGKWEAIAIEWADRRYGSAIEGLNRDEALSVLRKASDFLTRRGFDYSTMRVAIASLEKR